MQTDGPLGPKWRICELEFANLREQIAMLNQIPRCGMVDYWRHGRWSFLRKVSVVGHPISVDGTKHGGQVPFLIGPFHCVFSGGAAEVCLSGISSGLRLGQGHWEAVTVHLRLDSL